MRTRVYKTLSGFLRQSYYKQLSFNDILSGHFYDKSHNWVPFRLSAEAMKTFVFGVCGALNMRDKDEVLRNVTNRSVRSCGILNRLLVSTYKKELSYSYCAGQDYISETRLVRKLLRCK